MLQDRWERMAVSREKTYVKHRKDIMYLVYSVWRAYVIAYKNILLLRWLYNSFTFLYNYLLLQKVLMRLPHIFNYQNQVIVSTNLNLEYCTLLVFFFDIKWRMLVQGDWLYLLHWTNWITIINFTSVSMCLMLLFVSFI